MITTQDAVAVATAGRSGRACAVDNLWGSCHIGANSNYLVASMFLVSFRERNVSVREVLQHETSTDISVS